MTPGQGCEPNPYNAVGNVLADEGAVLKSVGYAFCELIPSAAAGVPSVLAGNAGDMSSVVWSGGAVLGRHRYVSRVYGDADLSTLECIEIQ